MILLLVLEDGEKHKWSKHIFVKPLQWPELNAVNVDLELLVKVKLCSAQSMYDPQAPFYIFYYNLERNTVVREGLKRRLFPNYIEDMKLM